MNPFWREQRDNVARIADTAQARLRQMQGRDLAIGFGGLLAGVALAGLVLQSPPQEKNGSASAKTLPAEKVSDQPQSAPDSSPIKMIGTSSGAVPCSDQTWPYIERRCLTEAPPRQDEPVTQAAAPQADAPSQIPAQQAGPVAVVTPALDLKPADTTGVAAAAELPKPELAPERTKKSKRHEDRRTASRPEQKADGEDQEPSAKRERQRGTRPAKRWRELVYDYPDGTRKRVTLSGTRGSAQWDREDDD